MILEKWHLWNWILNVANFLAQIRGTMCEIYFAGKLFHLEAAYVNDQLPLVCVYV